MELFRFFQLKFYNQSTVRGCLSSGASWGKCKIWGDKRTKCLVFSFCGVETQRGTDCCMGELRFSQQILKPERLDLFASLPLLLVQSYTQADLSPDV
ncbi:hypothetical protein F7725_000458 [Dissostichus mawsoni]|uniref:Uncharacterized protein n=1 Tax=Dissostichus mawsoni TaxID=36200 RepID=A0A7J5ZF26_DISMA|nr:hypothetical protein F7725_000458 [Dissostichus mawsoni]